MHGRWSVTPPIREREKLDSNGIHLIHLSMRYWAHLWPCTRVRRVSTYALCPAAIDLPLLAPLSASVLVALWFSARATLLVRFCPSELPLALRRGSSALTNIRRKCDNVSGEQGCNRFILKEPRARHCLYYWTFLSTENDVFASSDVFTMTTYVIYYFMVIVWNLHHAARRAPSVNDLAEERESTYVNNTSTRFMHVSMYLSRFLVCCIVLVHQSLNSLKYTTAYWEQDVVAPS